MLPERLLGEQSADALNGQRMRAGAGPMCNVKVVVVMHVFYGFAIAALLRMQGAVHTPTGAGAAIALTDAEDDIGGAPTGELNWRYVFLALLPYIVRTLFAKLLDKIWERICCGPRMDQVVDALFCNTSVRISYQDAKTTCSTLSETFRKVGVDPLTGTLATLIRLLAVHLSQPMAVAYFFFQAAPALTAAGRALGAVVLFREALYTATCIATAWANPQYLWVSKFKGVHDFSAFLIVPERFVLAALAPCLARGDLAPALLGSLGPLLIAYTVCDVCALAALIEDWPLRQSLWPLLVGYAVAASALPFGLIFSLAALLACCERP